jgi:hypothetical protein
VVQCPDALIEWVSLGGSLLRETLCRRRHLVGRGNRKCQPGAPAFGPVLGIELVISLEIQIALHAGDREQVADLRMPITQRYSGIGPGPIGSRRAVVPKICALATTCSALPVRNSAVPSQKVDHRRWATLVEFVYDIRHRAHLYGCDAGVMGQRSIALCDPARASPTQVGLLPFDPIGPRPTTISSLGEALPFLPMRSMPTLCCRGVRSR